MPEMVHVTMNHKYACWTNAWIPLHHLLSPEHWGVILGGN